jgi:hypothetical protein
MLFLVPALFLHMNICPKIELVEILTRPDQGTVGGGDTDQYGTPSLGYRAAGS